MRSASPRWCCWSACGACRRGRWRAPRPHRPHHRRRAARRRRGRLRGPAAADAGARRPGARGHLGGPGRGALELDGAVDGIAVHRPAAVAQPELARRGGDAAPRAGDDPRGAQGARLSRRPASSPTPGCGRRSATAPASTPSATSREGKRAETMLAQLGTAGPGKASRRPSSGRTSCRRTRPTCAARRCSTGCRNRRRRCLAASGRCSTSSPGSTPRCRCRRSRSAPSAPPTSSTSRGPTRWSGACSRRCGAAASGTRRCWWSPPTTARSSRSARRSSTAATSAARCSRCRC